MSNYRAIDLSKEIQDMYDTILKVTNLQERKELIEKLEILTENLSKKSKTLRDAINVIVKDI